LDIAFRESELLFIVNPAAGRGRGYRAAQRINAFLEKFGLKPRFLVSSGPGDAAMKARGAASSGVARIVVIGGDGTVQEVASGIAGTEVGLGIVPAGSGNDFIKAFGIPEDIYQALEVAFLGQVRPIDVGLIGDRHFVNMVGIGFDALVAAENLKLKYLKGFVGYLYALAKVFLRYRSPHVRIESDGFSFEGKVLLVAIGNGICCGGGFYLTPDALPDDGEFDVCIIRDIPKARIAKDIGKVFKGTHTELEPVVMYRCKGLRIESDLPLPIHADGEVLPQGIKEVSIDIFPRSLKVVTPAEGRG